MSKLKFTLVLDVHDQRIIFHPTVDFDSCDFVCLLGSENWDDLPVCSESHTDIFSKDSLYFWFHCTIKEYGSC